MAEALISAIMEQLVSILLQQAQEGIRLTGGAHEEVQKLRSNFRAIQGVLEDAESQQVKQKAVRDWLEKLRDVSYDIDDVLDEWNTAIQKLRMKEVEDASKPLRKVCSLFPCYGFCCRRVVVRYDIAIKIKNLSGRLGAIDMEKDRFKFSLSEGNQQLERPMTTSMIDISEVYGRDGDKNEVVNFLLSESSQGPLIPIISIVGMGGIGKTTLARLAFNDDKIKSHFSIKIWVCVSEPFNEIRIAKAILESLMNEKPKLDELEHVLQNIHQCIEGKRFLLVFDDVWTENSNAWEQIKNSLKGGSPGSKILVTTRKENAANVIGSHHMIPMGILPENECWSLFSKLAFFGKTKEECQELKGVGENIVQRCKGLPLAVKTLGSLLRFKRGIKEWQSILDSKMWEVEEVERGIFPPLLLSYYDLPSILKKCFSYCAIFPKDHQIEKFELIKLWMAQGYLKAKAGEDEESIGEKYFEILAVRSFFQDFQKDDGDVDIIGCKMHDIVHDFVQFLTKNECFTLELDDSAISPLESYETVRHLMVIAKQETSFPPSIYTMKHLRSLRIEDYFRYRDAIDLSKVFDQLTCLRTFHLGNITVEEFPRGIEKLIHLRYLAVSHKYNTKDLPETLCELYNLQILIVASCWNLQKLPQGIGNLTNLRYLDCTDTSISYMPKGFERLTCLVRLHDFVVGGGGYDNKACKVGCLKNFNRLKSLGIKGLGKLAGVGDLSVAQLNNKRNLVGLDLNFDGTVCEDHEVLLEAVQPPLHLEELTIEKYRGKTIFPNWFVSVTKLRHLRLSLCINCEHLPPLGKLPSLESLWIRKMPSIRRVGNEFLGIESDIATSSSYSSSVVAFPKLKTLAFYRMAELEDWDYGIPETESEQHVKILPCLHQLNLWFCPKLKSIPIHLLPITKSNNIYIVDCPLLEEYLDHEGQDLSTPSVED